MKLVKYQLSKYRDKQPSGGYLGVSIIGGFDSYISALLWKIITFHWSYRIERFEVDPELFKDD